MANPHFVTPQASPAALVLLAVGLFSASFQVLLPVVPVLLERSGPHGSAGAATAALFIAIVAGEFVTPWLLSRWGAAKLLIAGELLIAAPSLVFVIPHTTPLEMLSAAAVRGLGTGAAVVVSVTLLTELAPQNRRGRAIGYFGLATGVPGIIFPSIGVWLLGGNHSGLAAWIAFSAASLGALLGFALRPPWSAMGAMHTNLLVVLRPGLLAVVASFALISCSFGGVITYIPLALPGSGLGSAAVFFLIFGAGRAVSRWLSGLLGDRYSAGPILIGGLGLTAAGLVAVAMRGGPALVLCAATAYGLGYGAVQTAAYLSMAERSAASEWGVVSALWNSAIDIGSASGGAILGVSAALYGYSTAIWLMPVIVVMSLPVILFAGSGLAAPETPGPASG